MVAAALNPPPSSPPPEMFIDAVVVGPALSGRPRITVEGPQSVAMETSTGMPGKGKLAP